MAMTDMVDELDDEFEEPGEHPLSQFIGHPNIAELLDDEELAEIGQKVVREYDIDLSSRSEWEEKMKTAMDLAMQVSTAKSYPWPNASNVQYPLITVASIQFAARAYPAIVPDEQVVKAKVVGNDAGIPMMGPQGPVVDPNTGQQIWQVPPGAKASKASRVGQHMSWQLKEEMPEWEEDTDTLLHVLPIVGCVFRKTYFDPDAGRNRSEVVMAKDLVVNYSAKWERAHRKTQHVELYPHEVTERIRAGTFLDIDLGLPTERQDGDEDAPHLFLEQHRMLDLDDDGYPEPYTVTVHKGLQKVTRILPRYDDESVAVNPAGEVMKIEATEFYTRYIFMPAPDGSVYGWGFGSLLHDINNAVNSTINQLIDSGHLANTGGGFIGKGLRLKAGDTRFRPGEFKPVNVPGASVRENVVQLRFPEPSNVLFSLLGLLIEAGKDIASVKDVMTGEGQPNSTATTTMALIEQGMKVFSSIYKRIHRSMKGELKKLYRLNRLYMEPQVYFQVLDTMQQVAMQDYEDQSLDIVPVSDPNSITDMQKMARASFLQELMQVNPWINSQEATKRLLEAANIEDRDGLVLDQLPSDPQLAIDQQRTENDTMRASAGAQESQAKAMQYMANSEKLMAEADQEDDKTANEKDKTLIAAYQARNNGTDRG